MVLDEDDEQTNIPLPDGRTVCAHGNGTDQIRIVDAEPSEEAHVYDIHPDGILQSGLSQFLPMMLQAQEFKNKYVGSCKYLIGSECGRLFDQYFQQVIKEPTVYSANSGRVIDVPKLWPHRRLKMKFSSKCDSWIEGKVINFKNMCTGPYSPSTKWVVKIQLLGNSNASTFITSGQLLKIHGLKAGKQYNGKYGVITENKFSEGRYPILLKTGKMLAIKPANLKGVPTLEIEVGRMNVSGGGILLGEPTGLSDHISFEWIDSICNQWEPKMQKLEEDEYTLTLEMDPSELKSKQEQLHQEFAERTPSICGGPDCNRDGSPMDTPKRRAFQKYMKEEFGPRFFGLAKTDPRGFEELLMTEPLGLWNNDELADGMRDEVLKNPSALKVLFAVLKSRHQSGDINTFRRWVEQFGGPSTYSSENMQYDLWQSNFSFCIGEGYSDRLQGMSRAIPWLEESIERTKGGYADPIVLAERMNYLAYIYRKMGLLGKAFRLNCEACKHVNRSTCPVVHEDNDSLSKELKLWTGTAGYFLSENGRITLEELSSNPGEEKIESNVLSLKPHTQVPPHFGVMNGGDCWDPVPVDLPRPLTLRSLPKSMSKFDNKEAEDIFMSIYNGNFDVNWMAGSRDEYPDESFSFTSRLPPEANFMFLHLSAFAQKRPVPVMTTSLVIMPLPQDPNQAMFFQSLDTEEPYKSMFTLDQKSILSLRLLHWSVRLFGAKIDQSVKAEHICNHLKQEYTKASNWKDAIDASVIQVDFVYKSGNIQYINHYLNGVGEAMEAAKKFEAAAKVYGESAKLMVSKQRYSQAASLFQNAGLAYRRCERFKSSESLYFSSLHYDLKFKSNQLNLNNESFDTTITNMFVNYDMWLNERQVAGTEKSKTVHVVFSCLLYRAGFQARQGGRVGFAVHTMGQQMSGMALNDRCKTTRQCKEALANAISSSPDISTFHSKILGCKSAIMQSASFTPDSTSGTNGSSGTDKRAAREIMSSGLGVGLHRGVTCNNPACGRHLPDDEIKFCPCRKVSYCSVNCQRAHWKVHKPTCSAKKGKK